MTKASLFAIALVAVAIVSLHAAGGAATTAATDYDGEVLADAPRGYWRLGETSGTAAGATSLGVLFGRWPAW